MNAFLGFVRKEFYHIFRDRRTLLILFGMPLAQLLIFGFAIRNEVSEIRIAVVDPVPDDVTRQIRQRLVASGYFREVAWMTDAAGLARFFAEGRGKEAIVFEAGFARRLAREGKAHVQVITDATDPNTARTALAYTSAIIHAYGREQAGAHLPPPPVRTEFRMWFNPTMESVNLFVPGLVAFILMLVSTLMTSIAIAREKEMGTMEILLVSPLRPAHIIGGKVLPYLALAFTNVLTILVMARFVFGVPIRGSIPLLLFASMLFILTALALGILISTRVNSQQTAMMLSLGGLLLPTLILSGFIFPIASMPEALQILSHLVPAKWFLLIIRSIMLKGVGMAYVWKETLVLAGMLIVLTAAAIRNLNVRLE